MNDAGQTICLNMIVRNEAPVIRRCLASVLPIIDHWVIVDTGSSDGTQEIVRNFLKHVPGELIERSWVDFGHNRTEALGYARAHGQYVFVIDADEELEIAETFRKEELSADAYMVEVQYGGVGYVRRQLLRNDLAWAFIGVVHEYACCDDAKAEQLAIGLRIKVHHEGARARDPLTYRRDAILLETALLNAPDNARNVFYLAQSYKDAGDLDRAVRSYRQRAGMGGWSEEIWYSLYQVARLREYMNHAWTEVLQDYLAAYQFGPERAEPLYCIGLHYQGIGEYHTARLFLSRANRLQRPSPRSLFIEKDVYDYKVPLEYAAACAHAGDHEEAIATCNRLLRSDRLPPGDIDRVREIRHIGAPGPLRTVSSGGRQARIRICIPFCDPGSAFDDCIESVLLHNGASFDVMLIDDGSQQEYAHRIPVDRAGFTLIRNGRRTGFDACLDRFVNEQCDPDDVVIPLDYASRFAGRNIVERIRAAFGDDECELLYGQHRLPSGKMGDAEPAASEADFLNRLAALAGRSPIIFRARLWKEGISPALNGPRANGHGPATAVDGAVFDVLMKAAGFRKTRFSDDVFTIVGRSPAPRSEEISAAMRAGPPAGESSAAPAGMPIRTRASSELPVVSCLMVTHDRVALAKRSIMCFGRQTYPKRELVIVTDGDLRVRQSLERFVAELGLEGVRLVHEERAGLTLGELRNIAMDAAAGEVLCQWDDDDCHHPDRIRVQVEQMLDNNGRACFLTDHLQFLDDDRALVWVDWTLGGKAGMNQLLPGTMVMYKDDRFRYPESGPFAQRGEDSILLQQIYDAVPVVAAKGVGYLYLYTYHGRNTFDRDHHYRMSTFSRSVSELQSAREVIRGAMAHYPVSKPYIAIGRDGPAFILDD